MDNKAIELEPLIDEIELVGCYYSFLSHYIIYHKDKMKVADVITNYSSVFLLKMVVTLMIRLMLNYGQSPIRNTILVYEEQSSFADDKTINKTINNTNYKSNDKTVNKIYHNDKIYKNNNINQVNQGTCFADDVNLVNHWTCFADDIKQINQGFCLVYHEQSSFADDTTKTCIKSYATKNVVFFDKKNI